MGGSTLSTERTAGGPPFSAASSQPGLLLAWAPNASTSTDRARVDQELTLGRSRKATWVFDDDRMSSVHLRVRRFGESLIVEDLDSTNGTFVDGEVLDGARSVGWGSVVRAGRAVLITSSDLAALEGRIDPPPEIVGPFHARALVRELDVAVRTGRHVLLEGDSGTGKELGARFVATRSGSRLVAHNCARFTSSEEAEATLFGVGRGVFSGVEARASLLEEADGGALFLDEVHALPMRVQQSLLRFAEDGLHARIGSTAPRRLSVRLVFGTNVAVESGAIAPDLVARLYRVAVAPLSDRRADIPALFSHALTRAAGSPERAEPITRCLTADHFEALCLADWKGRNVRALESLADEIVARTADLGAEQGVRAAFALRLATSPLARRGVTEDAPSSHYERHRQQIVAAFQAARGNLSETERALKAAGLVVSRRWLADFLRKWGLRP